MNIINYKLMSRHSNSKSKAAVTDFYTIIGDNQNVIASSTDVDRHPNANGN